MSAQVQKIIDDVNKGVQAAFGAAPVEVAIVVRGAETVGSSPFDVTTTDTETVIKAIVLAAEELEDDQTPVQGSFRCYAAAAAFDTDPKVDDAVRVGNETYQVRGVMGVPKAPAPVLFVLGMDRA